jgi:predicted metal-dependent enzyme (double-stranded beta helix superfamily)
MISSDSPSSALFAICDRWADRLQALADDTERIDYIKTVLPELLLNRQLWERILQRLVAGDSYPDLRHATMFRDELILYPNNKRLFSLRMFIYDSRVYTPIHDHNSWGVIGSVSGPIEIIQYRREDDGSRDGFAQLRLDGRRSLEPGDIDVTYPLDAGIHQTGNPGRRTGIMLSVYGNPIRRLFINRFDAETNRVVRMYPPRMQKKKLARRALDAMRNDFGESQ